MRFEPHPYQSYVVKYIEEHPIAAVLLDMGLGKTVITLTALRNLMLDRYEVRKTLVIAPLRVARDTWASEMRKWDHLSGLSYAVAVGSVQERRSAIAENAMVTMINRENVPWLIEECGKHFDYDCIVIDELSSFKSAQAKRFKSLLKVRPRVKRMIGLTGTPSGNGLMDLWAQFRVLDMGERLGRYIGQYRQQYFTPDKRNAQVVFSYKANPGAEEAIYRRISDITVSMKAKDYLRLPACVMNTVEVGMSGEEREVYETLKQDLVAEIEGTQVDASNAAVLSMKLLQMAGGAIYDENKNTLRIHERKLDALEDLIEGANGKPVLVAYWFKHDAERIKSRFPVREIKTSKDIDDWNRGDIPVALIHPAAAGHGLNLQAGGSTLVWFSLTWSLELYQQTNARLYRQGQESTVVIHHILAKDTIDERVMAALGKKDQTQEALIYAVKAELKGVRNGRV